MSTVHRCEFCNKTFLNQYNLAKHQKTTKKCLLLQYPPPEIKTCKGCDKQFDNEAVYCFHIQECKDFVIYQKEEEIKALNKKNRELQATIEKLEASKSGHNKQVQPQFNITNNINVVIESLIVYDTNKIKEEAENLTMDDIRDGKKAAQYALNNSVKNMLFNTDANRGPLKAIDCDRQIRIVDHDELSQEFFNGIKDKAQELTLEEVEKRRLELQEKYRGYEDIDTGTDEKIDTMARNLSMIINAAEGEKNKISREFKKEIYQKTKV